MESIERMKGRIEDLQEQDFEMYKSDIADTIALRLWQKHQGDIDAIVANEKLEIESINKIDSICFVDGSRISLGIRATHRAWLGTSKATETPLGCCLQRLKEGSKEAASIYNPQKGKHREQI